VYVKPQKLQVAIANFLLVKPHEISKILVKSKQSQRAKSSGFTGLEIRVIHLSSSLSQSYPPSTG